MVEPQTVIAGRYRLLHRVGSGGMGVVWEGWDERLERRVAVKQLYRQSGTTTREAELANQRALREARLTARLQHPHAVPVFDAVEQDGQLWLIMQFIPSITLAAVLEEGGPLQPNEAAKVGAEVASALAAAHAVGIMHRDVKPGNILIAEDGAALISDFGIARALGDATLTSSGMIHGTPAYLAPEVARGSEANFASDVFSLGSTLYSALEGQPPFGTDDNTMALLHRVASGQFPPPQHGGAVTPVIMNMLSIDTDDRPSMGAVAERLFPLAGRGRSAELPVAAAVSGEEPEAEEVDSSLSQTGPSIGSDANSQQATSPPPTAGESPAASAPIIQDQRPAQPPASARPGGCRCHCCPRRHRNSGDCPAHERPPSSQSVSRQGPVELRRTREHRPSYAPAPERIVAEVAPIRAAAGSSTETVITNQNSYLIPSSVANDYTDSPGHANRGGAQAGDHQLLRVDAAQHRRSLATHDGLIPNQPCGWTPRVPAILGCDQQNHGG
jgi:serine/threonine protein kinase